MKYQVINHQHIFESETKFRQCHASTVCVLPGEKVGAAWFGGEHEKAEDVAIWFSVRSGGVWGEPRKVADVEGVPCWNPVLFAEGERLLLFYKVGKEIPRWQTFVKESQDWGETWSDARELVPGDQGGRGPVKNKCIRLQDGAILAPASTEENGWECFVDRSEDGGKTWRRSGNVPFDREMFSGSGMIQPTLWQDERGTVHMLMRSSEGAIYQSDSADGGRSWSKARKTALPNNNCGIDLARLSDGRLVLVYNPVSGNWAARSPIAFTVSEDNGRSWSNPEILDHVPCRTNIERAEFSYPAIVAQGNDVYITYTWKRRTIAFWQLRFPEREKKEGLPEGLWPVMLTPFTGEKEVDYDGLRALTGWYLDNGAAGLFAVCLSNEMELLTEEERLKITACVKETAGDVPVASTAYVEVPTGDAPVGGNVDVEGDAPVAGNVDAEGDAPVDRTVSMAGNADAVNGERKAEAAVNTGIEEKESGSEELPFGGPSDSGRLNLVEELIASVRRTAAAGADIVVLLTNSFVYRDESEDCIKKAITRILEAVPDVRFGLYECPKPYKRLFSPELVAWCAKTGRFVFYKETSLSRELLKEKLEAVKGTPLKIFNADSSLMYEFLKMGGHGHCGVMLNFHPELYRWMMDNWNEDRQLAEQMQQLMTITAHIERQCYPRSAKYALGRRGVPVRPDCRRENADEWSVSCVRAVEDMEKLTGAYFAELERKFLTVQ